VGLTPSRQQCDWIGHHIGCTEIEVVCSLWQDADAGAGYDAAFSLGALEHFARPGLPAAGKIRSYQSFFEFCRRSVSDEGRLSIQFVGWMDVAPEAETDHLPIGLFPESNLPRLAEVIAAADPTFHPLSLENVPGDYALTLHAWLAKINAHRDELVRMHGRPLVKTYIHAFRRFLLGFESGSLGLYRIAFRPRRPGR
jgi:cyclopropane-fatty-acyl-phospholipid synthase